MTKKMLQTRHRDIPKPDGSYGNIQGEWTNERVFSFNKHNELSSLGAKFLRSIDRDRYEIRWVPVVQETKVDEAVSLNVSNTEGEMNSNTTINAASTMDLVTLLKNAGIKSAMFNGPATLTAGENIDDQNSITTTVQAPNLRAIMNMLEPEFQALGDLEAGVDDMDVGMDDQMIDPAPGDAVDASIDNDGNLAIVDESDLGESVDLNSKIKWPSTAWDFAILCGKTVATLEGNPDDYDAVEFQDYAEDIYREYPKKKPNWTVKDLLKDLGSNGYGVPSISDDGSKMSFHSADQWMAAAKKAGYTFGSDGYGSRDAFNKNHEKVGEWTGQYGNISTANSGWLVLKSSKNEQVEHDVHPTEYAGVADKKIVQPSTKRVPARSGDNPLAESDEDDYREFRTWILTPFDLSSLKEIEVTVSYTWSQEGVSIVSVLTDEGLDLVDELTGKQLEHLEGEADRHYDESNQDITEAPYKPGGSDEFDTWIEDETSPAGEIEVTVHYDWDSGDFSTGLDHMPIASMGSSLEVTAVIDKRTGEDIIGHLNPKVIEMLTQQAIDHGSAPQEESVEPKSFRDYVEEASKKSKNPQFGYGVYGVGYFARDNEEDHGEDTSAELGFDMGGDFGESLNELSGDLKNRYARKARVSKDHHEKKASELDDLVYDANQAERMGIMRKGAGDRVAKWRNAHDRIAWKREKGLDRVEPTAESLLDEFKGSDLEEVQINYNKGPHTKYGEPFYLNTDCGYASLEDIKNGKAQYFDDMSSGSSQVGVTVLEIDRNGKKGLNYVSGLTKTPKKTEVTCITQTSTGTKYRPGKVITSFTAHDIVNNYEMVVDLLSEYGVSPTKKLSVKTFD